MTIDLRTGEEYVPRLEDYCTKVSGTWYCREMRTPQWHAFLDRVTDGNEDLRNYLQRVAGYCLTGCIDEQCLFFLHGTGANGKTVFINTLYGIWGDYAVTAPMDLFMHSRHEQHPTGLAHLRGARLVIATETDGGERWSEGKIKRLTGGDTISARYMRGDFFEFVPQFKLLIAGNHTPALHHVDEAIRRRIHLIPFTVTIPPEERDLHLADRLKEEWPGILAWAVEGCLARQNSGLRPPAAVTDATAAYLEAEDTFAQWLSECCEPAPDWTFERTADLYTSFSGWLEKAGEKIPSMKRFATTMKERGFVQAKNAARQGGFQGIRIKAMGSSARLQD